MKTRGDMLRFAIAFALMRARKLVRGLRQGLSEDERYLIADGAWFTDCGGTAILGTCRESCRRRPARGIRRHQDKGLSSLVIDGWSLVKLSRLRAASSTSRRRSATAGGAEPLPQQDESVTRNC